jgi:phosphoribosyl-ATP pyrophosphohydrolase
LEPTVHSDDVKRFISLGQPHLLPTGLSVPSLGQHEWPILSNAASALSTFAAILEAHGSTATALGCRLMLEELGETIEAVLRGDVAEFADGLADLLYVTLWSAVVHGVPIEAVFAEVQRANLAKFPVCSACEGHGAPVVDRFADGAPLAVSAEPCAACGGKGRVVIRDAAGKVKKPEGWTPPDVRGVLRRAEEACGVTVAEAVKAPSAPGPNPVPVAEIIPWTKRPDWLVDLFANSAEVSNVAADRSPELTHAWWAQDWRMVDGAWSTGSRESADGYVAHDVAVVLMAPPGAQETLFDCIFEVFDYGSPVYWTEASTPYGRRLIALLTDS